MSARALRLVVLRSRREEGQALVLTAFALIVLIGFAGLVIDMGRLYIAQRQLQQAVDASALAAGANLPNAANAYTAAVNYSATNFNQHPASMSANPPLVTFKCLSLAGTNINLPCGADLSGSKCQPSGAQPPLPAGTTTCNAVKVTESASVSTTLLHLFLPAGFTTVSASSAALARGGVPHPLDIMVVLDTTGSMSSVTCNEPVQDESGNTVMTGSQAKDIDCAKDGVRRLLKGLLPCAQSVLGNCGGAPALDKVGLMVFPGLSNPSGYDHDSTNTLNNLQLEFMCPGSLSAKPSWYKPNQAFPNWFLNNGADAGYPTNAVQKITISGATGGTFTLSYGGQTTSAIAYNATAANVQDALANLSTIGLGNVVVTGNNGGPFTVTFEGTLGNQAIPVLGSDGSTLIGTGHSVTVVTTTNGSLGSYLISGLDNDFKVSDAATSLNPQSYVALATTWDSCPGGTVPTQGGTPNRFYGVNTTSNTYYAGAITAAQNLLASDSSRHAQPVIILLSDGDANTAPDGPNPCHQAIAAAKAAAQAGTWVYSIAYNATNGGCGLDTNPTISSFATMQQIAQSPTNQTGPNGSDPSKFFCEPVPAGQTCNTASSLAQIFLNIGTDLTDSRLLLDTTS